MAIKRRIIYEDKDEDGNDDTGNNHGSSSSKRSRRASDEPVAHDTPHTLGKPSRIDVALQGEQINPMAPSSQDAREQGSRCQQVDSNSPDMISLQSHAPPRSPQPVFSLAAASQEFSFRLPDVASQAHMSVGTAAQTQVPPCAQFHGLHDVGGPQLHQHLVHHLSALQANKYIYIPPNATSETSILQMFQFEDFDEQNADPSLAACPTRLQCTASFYDIPLTVNKNGHSITMVPRVRNDRDEPQIDEASPSEDDRYRALTLSPGIHSITEVRCITPFLARSNLIPTTLPKAIRGSPEHHASYQWDPKNHCEQNIEIARCLLGNGSLFLKNGVDDEGHTNNLTHPALTGLIIDFFYSGSTLVGQLFPEVFSLEVPRVAVAIATTAIFILDEIVLGVGKVNFRVATYSPIYVEILRLMSKCDTSPIHQAKTRTLHI
ncbi:hypothetical protein F5141DRAFT_1210629 [Pisolithus sp. B1]|nr:hypothetical protein F5141DRAFT_1210629 [Pisolithus sp. B1]